MGLKHAPIGLPRLDAQHYACARPQTSHNHNSASNSAIQIYQKEGANKCITQSVHCPEAVLTMVPYTTGHDLAAVGPELPQQTVTPPSSALHPMVVVPHGKYMCR